MRTLLHLLHLVAALAAAAAELRADELGKYGWPLPGMERRGPYAVAYDGRTRTPIATLHLVEGRGRATAAAERPTTWRVAAELPAAWRPSKDDYAGGPYQRGHCVPNGDLVTAEDREATFVYGVNCVPEWPAMNQGPMRAVEEEIRRLAAGGTAHVATLVLYLPDDQGLVRYPTIGPRRVGVPTHVAKAVLIARPRADPELRAWLLANVERPPTNDPAAYRLATRALESLWGRDLWDQLPEDLAARLEGTP